MRIAFHSVRKIIKYIIPEHCSIIGDLMSVAVNHYRHSLIRFLFDVVNVVKLHYRSKRYMVNFPLPTRTERKGERACVSLSALKFSLLYVCILFQFGNAVLTLSIEACCHGYRVVLAPLALHWDDI